MKEDYVRKRNKYVNFRVTPEEHDLLFKRIALSGLKKQDYLAARVLDKTIVVKGNPKVFKALKDQIKNITEELRRIKSCSDQSEEFYEVVIYILELLQKLNEN